MVCTLACTVHLVGASQLGARRAALRTLLIGDVSPAWQAPECHEMPVLSLPSGPVEAGPVPSALPPLTVVMQLTPVLGDLRLCGPKRCLAGEFPDSPAKATGSEPAELLRTGQASPSVRAHRGVVSSAPHTGVSWRLGCSICLPGATLSASWQDGVHGNRSCAVGAIPLP